MRRKTRVAGRFWGLVKMALTVAALVALIVFVIRWTSKPSVFLDGVYVNGVPLGGLSYSGGYEKVSGLAGQRLNSNPIRIFCGEKSWTLTPSMLGASMDVKAQLVLAWNIGHTGNFFQRRAQQDYLKGRTVAFNSKLVYDEARLDQFIAGIKSEIDVAPIEATLTLEDGGRFTITDSADGLALDGNALKEALAKVIVEGSAPEIQLVQQAVGPRVTADELRAGTQLIATCTTDTSSSSSNRTWNIRRALSPFNGFVVQPGETVSVNKKIGKRTLENKFREAPEFAGTNVQMGIGGGVCQASSTLYKALLTAGMTVEERWQHNMTVGYIAPSLDATINNDEKDLVFTNNRDSAIYIFTSVNDKRAQVKIYGKRPEYDIRPTSEIIQKNIPATSVRKKKDTSGKHAYYTDETKLESEGKPGLRSRALLYYYDWNTGLQVGEPDELHEDYYYPSPPVYWVGIHEREAELLP
jgi:vancomycin resistance protein YoaR